jgi:hypothetical protein
MSTPIQQFSLSDILQSRVMFLYGAVQQGNINFNLQDATLSLTGTNIPYDPGTVSTDLELVNTLLNEYNQEETPDGNMIRMLEDIKRILEETLERLSWLQ